MASYNKVMLMGNLTRDPEVRYTPKGSAVADLAIAVNRVYTAENGERREEVTYVDVTLWARTAEIAGQYLKRAAPFSSKDAFRWTHGRTNKPVKSAARSRWSVRSCNCSAAGTVVAMRKAPAVVVEAATHALPNHVRPAAVEVVNNAARNLPVSSRQRTRNSTKAPLPRAWKRTIFPFEMVGVQFRFSGRSGQQCSAR
jgi:hypothetical protein